ncbi:MULTISPECIES: hypothetical protein [unclassified Legionella]|uniref:hypothetical protein n=1 Tax=unclassified Legionella TaxID=2622702 RepID=UPI0010569F23|nr:MULTISPECIES: hypothetical protein [unclassified Legionella]MDI9818316.1 hypothetical protein [Legionella sp. PL877]
MNIAGCALWLGEGKPGQYWNAVRSFLSQNEEAKVNIFFSKKNLDLPEYLNKKHLSEKALLPDYEKLINRIIFFDIDANNFKYVQWLEQFEPTPYAFISDYLRFAALSQLSVEKDYNCSLIVFFELDVEFKNSIESIKEELVPDAVLLPEYESSLYVIFVNQPGKNANNLLNGVLKVYDDLYEKVLISLDVQNKPENLDMLENEKYITEMLGMSLEALSKTEENSPKEVKKSSTNTGFVNLRGFFSVIQGFAKDIFQNIDEAEDEQSLFEVDVGGLIEHFPSSKEYVYRENSYRLKVSISTDTSLSQTASKPLHSIFFSEPSDSKRIKTAPDSNEVVEQNELKPW